jgi:hypothetical protein
MGVVLLSHSLKISVTTYENRSGANTARKLPTMLLFKSGANRHERENFISVTELESVCKCA